MAKVAISAISYWISGLMGGLNANVLCLTFGVIFTKLAFDDNAMNKAGVFNLCMVY